MNNLTRFFKRNVVSPILFHTGVLRFAAKNKDAHIIINFHGVKHKKERNPLNNRHLDLDIFVRLLRYLASEFNIRPLSELYLTESPEVTFPKRKTKPSAYITFDDGYMNNFTLAAPILEELKIPATFFIVTASLYNPDFINWPDIVDYIIFRDAQRCRFSFGDFTMPNGYSNSHKLYLSDYIKKSGVRLHEILEEIKDKFPELESDIFNFESFVRMVDASTLSRFKDSSIIDFGSHTHTHYCLEYAPEEIQYQELYNSRLLLEEVLMCPVEMVAYPDGSYNESVLNQTQRAGYKQAFVVNYRLGEKRTPNFYKPRFTIANSTTFHSNINRLYHQYYKFSF